MRSHWIVAIGAVLPVLLFAATAQAQSCSNVLFSGAPTAVPGGFGVPWNPFSFGKELLLSGSCTEAGKVTATVGGGQEVYVYTQGHAWDGSQWKPLSLSGGTAAGGSWIRGKATGSFAAGKNGVSVFLGYTCQFVANSWKCGCQNAECSAPSWQVQAVSTPQAPTTGGGGGSGGSSSASGIEPPPPMDPGFLNVENVCPGEAGWPSASQMAGKDVKITLPKTRECRPAQDLTPIQGTESNPVKDVWIVGGVLRGSGFSFRNYSGTMFVEGVIIDQLGKCQDAVNSYFGRGDGGRIVVQNSHFTGISYCDPGTHGDTFHAQGSGAMLKEFKAENLWAHQIRQGIFVPPRTSGPYPGHGVKKMTLNNVFLEADPNHAMAGKGIASMMYWAEGWGPPPDGVHFNNVYLKWWGGKSNMSQNPWGNVTIPAPSGYDSAGCSQYAASAKVTGKWCRGAPPKGNVVSLDKIGLNYNRASFTGS